MTKHRAANGVFTITGALATSRSSHTARSWLMGRFAVVGGSDRIHLGLDSAELYDRKTGVESDRQSPCSARRSHSDAAPIRKVLVSSGRFGPDSINTTELYDPATGEWSTTGSLKMARSSHTATLLPGGLVLAAGGVGTQDFPDSGHTGGDANVCLPGTPYGAGSRHLGRMPLPQTSLCPVTETRASSELARGWCPCHCANK